MGFSVKNHVQVFAPAVDLIARYSGYFFEKKTKSIHKILRDTTLKLNMEKILAMQFYRQFSHRNRMEMRVFAIRQISIRYKIPLDTYSLDIHEHIVLPVVCAAAEFLCGTFVYIRVSDICGIWSYSIKSSMSVTDGMKVERQMGLQPNFHACPFLFLSIYSIRNHKHFSKGIRKYDQTQVH